MTAQPVESHSSRRRSDDLNELLDIIANAPDGDGYRYEIINGELVVTPPPPDDHQGVLEELRLAIAPALPSGWRMYGDTGILAGGDRTVPDLIILDKKIVRTGQQYVERPVRVVVEIESPSTKYRDRRTKFDAYARQGIDAYWRIERDGTTHVHTRPGPDGTWGEVRTAGPGEELTVTDPFQVTLRPVDWLD